ncbi:SDR family oxidoreductase [Paenibacillus terrae]|uniref:SDR family oxidoreductase n=1 Tax=Paenibacillus terrae TaxID=159743 RepID=UPI000ABCE697|nr:NAD(P)H-binding protein [Paenibacillus terrae]
MIPDRLVNFFNDRHQYSVDYRASGKTGSRIAARLTQLQHPVRLAGRSNSTNLPGSEHVHFDWYDESTHTKALTNVDKVYLVVPVLDVNPAKVMIPFIEKSIHEGVKRFVLLGSASVPADGPVFGPVHQALSNLAPEWTVLQPSYFMQNFTEGPACKHHQKHRHDL